MDRLERAVRTGLKQAAGKPMEEAVEAMLDCLSLVLGVGDVPRGTYMPPPAPPEATAPSVPDVPRGTSAPSPAAPPIDPPRLTDLAPIEGARDQETKVRTWWEANDLYQHVLDNAPPYIEIVPEGRTESLSLTRDVVLIPGDYPGVALAYKPAGADDNVPYPKETFWSTSEEVDLARAIKKMSSDAERMYRVRNGSIRQGIPHKDHVEYVHHGDV